MESENGRTVVPVGDIMTGSTDMQGLSPQYRRYSPAREGTGLNAHAVDEPMEITAHVEGMRVYYGKFGFHSKRNGCLITRQITPGMKSKRVSS